MVVIGAGSAGVRFARMAAQYGAKVAIIENLYYGGTCVNVGCVPKKLYVYASAFAQEYQIAQRFGWQLEAPVFDWGVLRDNKKAEIKRLNGIYQTLLVRSGVDCYWGPAEFKSPTEVQVQEVLLRAEKIVIATGSWPNKLSVDGAEHAITSNEVFDLPELPKRILIVGAGYIGVEFAGIFNGLGVKTTLCHRAPLPLRGFDEQLRAFLKAQMLAKGIEVKVGVQPLAIELAQGAKRVCFSDQTQQEYDVVLMATGRVPNTVGLGLESCNIETDIKGAIVVDAYYQTSQSSVFALGDVINKVALTPVAIAEAMVLARNLFGAMSKQVKPAWQTLNYEQIPSAVFSQPCIGTVGLSEQQAAQCEQVDIYESEFTPMKHTLGGIAEKSFCKLVVSRQQQIVLGIHIVGPDAGEIVQGFAVCLKMGVKLADLHNTVGIHPTLAEELVTMRTPVRTVGP